MKLIYGDCLVEMGNIPEKSVNLVLCDLPYGSTHCKWDTVIPFPALWEYYWKLLTPNGVVALFGSNPFTSIMITSQLKYYRYNWTWNKVNRISGHLNAKKQPLRTTEDICIFYKKQPTYNPQMERGIPYTATGKQNNSTIYGSQKNNVVTENKGYYYPKNIIKIKADERGTVGRLHPAQKPVALLEYLIKTYSNQGDLVLDNCMGVGSTGVAAANTGRNFIGIEKDQKYFHIAEQRIHAVVNPT